MNLSKWIEENHLNVNHLSDSILEIDGFGKFLIVSDKDITFDERFILNLNDDEIDVLSTDVEYLLFQFGDFWFYHHKDKDTELNLFRYLGKSIKQSLDIPHLGVHGKYELLNGSREYEDWVKKAIYLGYTALGICERETLAGCYYFQHACDKYGMKAIHGRECLIRTDSGYSYYIKVYAKNNQGWSDLLKIHNTEKIINKDIGGYIEDSKIGEFITKDVYVVINYDTNLDNINLDNYVGDNCFFQFNIVEFNSNQKDQENLINLKKYLEKYIDIIQPLVFSDTYYIDSIDFDVKNILNQISGKFLQFKSKDEWLKPYEQTIEELSNLIDNEKIFDRLVESSLLNLKLIEETTDFKLSKGDKHLPTYIMNDDEKLLYSSSEDMFFSLIEKGFAEKIAGKVEDESIYLDRLETEIDVLQEGQVIDYFLILYDVYNYMKDISGLTSIGRGSAAGSLVSYLLNIVQLDPIKYDLLFERFLNKSRILTGALPDIDSDIPSSKRQQVIEYVVQKYGEKNVTFIGTAQALKLKSALKDLLRLKGFEFSQMNLLSSFISAEDNNKGIEAIFEICYKEPLLKKVIKDHPDIVYNIYLMLNQPRSFGIHAAGVVIFPSEDKQGNKTTALDYVPLRYSNNQLVTEWEKNDIEEIGLLKADLLGLSQLDKIVRMNELIKENGKSYLPFEQIDLEDKKVFDLFKKGITEDIFQFNTDVQKGYLLQLNPDGVEDLIAANALNRPGAMESNSHIKYISIKNGDIEKEDMPLVNDLLENTRSLLVYQEQVMNVYQRLAECDFVEAEQFRRTISKSKPGKIDPNIEKYQNNFITSYVKKGVDIDKASEIWDKIIGFTSYSFNRSHAAAYALTGYWAAYYKAHFPIEFYTSSLEFANKDAKKDILVSRLISEIQSSNLVNLKTPNINKSGRLYYIDSKNNEIYWSLASIRNCGEKTLDNLLKERDENGQYFSFEEFVSRVKENGVNRRSVLNIVLSGGFDEIENIHEAKDRYRLIKQWGDLYNQEKYVEEEFLPKDVVNNFFWVLLQKRLCGLGIIDYKSIFNRIAIKYPRYIGSSLCNFEELQNKSVESQIVVGGVIKEIKEITTKKGDLMCQMQLDCNDSLIHVTVWSSFYEENKDLLLNNKNQPIFITGNVIYDEYRKVNSLVTDFNTNIIEIKNG